MSERVSIDIGTAEPAGQPWPARPEGGAEPAGAERAKPSRIALLAHCGTGNLGDEGSIASVLDNIRRRWPGVSVLGLSMDPQDTERRHGIPSVAMRQTVYPFQEAWSLEAGASGRPSFSDRLKQSVKKLGPLFRVAKALRENVITRPAQILREIPFLIRSLLILCELDVMIISGGGQLLDWGGPWAFPYTLFKWVLLAKCANVKCVFLNSGAGPLDAPLSRWFVRRTLNLADYVSLRDSASGELLRKVGFGGKTTVVADAVWNLRLPEHAGTPSRDGPTERVIGIAPMAYGDPKRHWLEDGRGYRHLIDNLAQFSCRMIERGYRIKLFSSDIWFDAQAIADLDAAIREACPELAPGQVTRETIAEIDGLLSALSGLDCYVTCRFHGVVFASLMNVPAIALSPHPKVTDLMAELGLSDYCVDISQCEAEDLTARADRLLADADAIKAGIAANVARFQAQLTEQFDELFLENVGIYAKKPR